MPDASTPPFQPLLVHGPDRAAVPLVLDSPHSGTVMPPDFDTVQPLSALREGEDCFIDALWQPATTRGVPLLAAQFPRTYLDANRHEEEVDLDLLDGPWPHAWRPSAKAAIGKGLVWRTLDADRPLYARRLTVGEMQHRIATCHRPYHATLQRLLDEAHAAHGAVWHINCHSMGSTTSVLIEGVDGRPRADFVLGDRDGSTCDPAFTALVRDKLAGFGYHVAVNDPFKGVELVRLHGRPAERRHSLQLEVNKRLYMDEATLRPSAGFATVQQHLMAVVDALLAEVVPMQRVQA
jgi:N-formylglutamate amidohydrolase